MADGLARRHVLLTRPAEESAGLSERLQRLGAVPLVFPALVIEPLWNAQLPPQLERARRAAFIVFVSPSAVRCYFDALARAGVPADSPARAVAIGPGTARALGRHGIAEVLVPEQQYDSDAVAALPELGDPAGQAVAIVCGIGGRRSLGSELAARGAAVEHIECYRRVRPQASPADLIAVWERDGIAAALLTSSEGVRNLWDILGETGRRLWRDTPTFVPHERIRSAGAGLGLRRIVVTGPGDDAMLAALTEFFR